MVENAKTLNSSLTDGVRHCCENCWSEI